MDALAGYGSESSSESEGNNNGNDNNQKSGALSGLLGYEESSDDSDDQSPLPDKAPPPAAKRRRTQQETKTSVLPPPALGQNDSIIYWDVNYLAEAPRSEEKITSSSAIELSQKLEKLATNLKVSWAEHLKAQHEFHNPHFFESVVEHFGIAPLGSQIRNNFVMKDYERELFPNKND